MFNTFIVDTKRLIKNIKYVRLTNPKSMICAMVKANAYGVGLSSVVKTIDNYVDYYGVVCDKEARETYRLTKKPILIVGALPNKIDTRFIYTCHDLADIKRLIELKKDIRIDLKINSGMNRFGFKSKNEFINALKLIKHSNLHLHGIFTHFATADEYIHTQMQVFDQFVQLAQKMGFNPIVHADNSIVSEIENHNLDMVRVGFSLYDKTSEHFLPVVSIKTKIVQINNVGKGELVGYNRIFVAPKKMKVAIIPIGYADGFDLSYIGLNLNIRGKDCKVLNICMDCFMLDISGLRLKKGDSIFILDTNNPLSKYSNYNNSSEYEVMTKFSKIRANRRKI